MSCRTAAYSWSCGESGGKTTTATDDYLPGAIGEQALGYGPNLDALEGQHVAISLPAHGTRQVVISCSFTK
jgi:hypothetical protein